tara:strand:+ start:448 stop:1083 length:636 start_codon:yes stop_codon:yes gene_type:complete
MSTFLGLFYNKGENDDEEVIDEVIEQEDTRIEQGFDTEVQGEVKTDAIKHLRDLLISSNLPGYDYMEFMASVSKRETSVEKDKYTIVYDIVKDTGVTVEHLLSTADKYIAILENEEEQFNGKLQIEHDKTCEMMDQVSDIDTQIGIMTQQIEELQGTIAEQSGKQNKLKEEINTRKIEKAKQSADFQASMSLVKNDIEENKQKIKTYLEGE